MMTSLDEVEVAIETAGVKNKKLARRLRVWGGVVEDWPTPDSIRVNFGRWKPLPDDERKRGILKVIARPGDIVIVCQVGRHLPVTEQRVQYFSVVQEKATQVVALELLASVVDARRRFLFPRKSTTRLVNEDSGEGAARQLRVA